MQFSRCVMAVSVMAATGMIALACATGAAQGQPHLLRTARAVHSLPPEEAAKGVPIHLRAVLTYYDPYIDSRRGAIFVCDHSGCVFVSVPHRPILPLHTGDLVEISGVTGAGDYASIVDAATVTVAGKSALPKPLRLSVQDLYSGTYDCDWVEVEGQVRAVHFGAGTVALEIESNGRSFPAASVIEPGADYEKLIDSQVMITANTSPVFNSRRQMVGVHAFFPSIRQIRVIRAAPNNPFDLAPMHIADLFGVSTAGESSHRVHVEGVLTLDWPGRMICIQSGADGLCMDTRQKTELPLGTPVAVVGFPSVSGFKPTLEEAAFRPSAGQSVSAPPLQIKGSQGINDSLDGRLVTFTAELIGQDLAAAEPTLMVNAGGELIPAVISKEGLSKGFHAWREGSLLRVTGICSVQVDTWSISLGNGMVQPESARILLRSADDIVVVHAPSWWTPQHTLMCLAAVSALILVAFAWIIVLRHSVTQRTRELHESKERLRYLSEHDALTGLCNRVLLKERLRMALEAAGHNASHVGLLMADVDGFKAVNDALGHHAGDQLLCELARRLKECVRLTDTVARIGGDEFLVLLPDLHHPGEAEVIATKIVGSAAKAFSAEGISAEITLSIGIAVYPEAGLDDQTLMRHADEAMYAAKSQGKNAFRVYGTKSRSAGSERSWRIPHAPFSPS